MQIERAYGMLRLYTHGRARPKYGANSEFIHFVDEHDKIVAENSAERRAAGRKQPSQGAIK